MGVVINGKVAYTVEKNTPNAFEHNSGYYLWEQDYIKYWYDKTE